MKHFGLLCILLILVHFSTQIPQFENCPQNIMTTHNSCECCKVTCFLEGTEMSLKACALSLCLPGEQIGYHDEDNTKEFPDCCGHPICKN